MYSYLLVINISYLPSHSLLFLSVYPFRTSPQIPNNINNTIQTPQSEQTDYITQKKKKFYFFGLVVCLTSFWQKGYRKIKKTITASTILDEG